MRAFNASAADEFAEVLMQAWFASIFAQVAELGVFFAAAAALTAGLWHCVKFRFTFADRASQHSLTFITAAMAF